VKQVFSQADQEMDDLAAAAGGRSTSPKMKKEFTARTLNCHNSSATRYRIAVSPPATTAKFTDPSQGESLWLPVIIAGVLATN